jgi:hypothetical protein
MINNIEDYKNQVSKIENTVNAVYSRLTFSTIAEVLEEEIDLRGLWNTNHKLNMKLHSLYNEAYDMLEYVPEEELDDMDMVIDDINSKVGDKLDALDTLIDSLEEILNKDDEYGIKKHFQDIKQINID